MRHALTVLEKAKKELTQHSGRATENAKHALMELCRLEHCRIPNDLLPDFCRLLERLGYEHHDGLLPEAQLDKVWIKLHQMRIGDYLRVTYDVICLEDEIRRYAEKLPADSSRSEGAGFPF
jgi:hypothetical protein